MRFEFQIVDGPSPGRRFSLQPNTEMIVGRTEKADQAIASDLIMSSLHFKLLALPTGCRVQDLGSTNGTFLNGRRIQESELNNADTITAGSTTFELRIRDSGMPVPPAAAIPSPHRSDITRETNQRQEIESTSASVLPDAARPAASNVTQEALAVITIDGPTGVRSVSLFEGQPRIFGRTKNADIIVPDERISSLHFSLQCVEGVISLNDLGSSNGTFIDGQRVEKAVLHAGSAFTAGRTEFRVAEMRTDAQLSPTPTAATGDTAGKDIIQTVDEVAGSRERQIGVGMHTEPQPTESVQPIDSPALSPLEVAQTEPALKPDTPTVDPTTEEIAPTSEERLEPESALDSRCNDEDVAEIQLSSSISSKWPYENGLTDSDSRVRASALLAAVFSRQPWLLDQCRTAARIPSMQQFGELMLLAILGGEDDLPLFERLCRETKLGTARFRLVGVYGNPQLIPMLLGEISSDLAPTAVFAGQAFTKITGCNIASEAIVDVATLDGKEPIAMFLPDTATAKSCWEALESDWSSITRASWGIALHPRVTSSDEHPLDMETLLEISIRETFVGTRVPSQELLAHAIDYITRVA